MNAIPILVSNGLILHSEERDCMFQVVNPILVSNGLILHSEERDCMFQVVNPRSHSLGMDISEFSFFGHF